MKIYITAVGANMPTWVEKGFDEYAGRLKQDIKLQLIEVNAGNRTKSASTQSILKEEGRRLLQAIPKGAYIVGLDVLGKTLSTPEFSHVMQSWLQLGRDIAILIGGPEGFSDEVRQSFDYTISLSRFTFPHPLVRIILAEQIYRGWSMIHNHPYHRA